MEDKNGLLNDILSPILGGAAGAVVNTVGGLITQGREFRQQEDLMDKQNEYNLPTAQMARLRAAGINPNVAASQIAGNNVSATPSNVPTAQNLFGSNVDAVKSGADIANSLAQSRKALTESDKNVSEKQTIDETRDLIKKDYMSRYNLTNAQYGALAISNQFLSDEHLASLMLTDAQIQVAQSQSDNYRKQIDVYDSQIKALEAAAQYDEALKIGQEKINFALQFRNDFMQTWGFDPTLPFDNMLAESFISEKGSYGQLYQAYSDYHHIQQSEQQKREEAVVAEKYEEELNNYLQGLEAEKQVEAEYWYLRLLDAIPGLSNTAFGAMLFKKFGSPTKIKGYGR